MGEALLRQKVYIPFNFYGIICVNMPEGTVCSCSNGTTILTAPTGVAQYIFYTPTSGMWEITGIKGNQQITLTINISQKYQYEERTLIL